MRKSLKKTVGPNSPERTMSSLVIARITGKRHDAVLRDIRNILSQGVDAHNFVETSYTDKAKRLKPCYEITKKGCLLLASGYNVLLRERIINRWEELELQRIAEEQNPELSVNKAIEAYRNQGKTDAWIATRMSGIVQRNAYTKTLQDHDVKWYGTCTDEIYKGLFGLRAKEMREKKDLAKGANLREHMNMVQLSATMLSEALATENIEQNDVRGDKKCAIVSRVSARSVANAVTAGRKALGTK